MIIYQTDPLQPSLRVEDICFAEANANTLPNNSSSNNSTPNLEPESFQELCHRINANRLSVGNVHQHPFHDGEWTAYLYETANYNRMYAPGTGLTAQSALQMAYEIALARKKYKPKVLRPKQLTLEDLDL